MSDNKNFEIQSFDEYRLYDKTSMNGNKQKKPRPRGHVYVYSSPVNNSEDKELISEHEVDPVEDDENLVVYSGREWVAPRLFNVDNPNIIPSKDAYICWFGLGTGGTTEGDLFTPVDPQNTDSVLNQPIPISPGNNNYGDLRTDGFYKKQLESVEFETDYTNDDSWLIAKATLIVTGEDANVDDPLSEAGLFVATTDDAGYDGPFTLFSRVTFSSIQKDSTRQLTFIWYVYV